MLVKYNIFFLKVFSLFAFFSFAFARSLSLSLSFFAKNVIYRFMEIAIKRQIVLFEQIYILLSDFDVLPSK